MLILSMRRKMKELKFFFRLLNYFIFLLVIMFFAMVTIYFITNINTKQAINNKIQSNIENSGRMIDAHMEVIQNIGLNLFRSEEICNYFQYDAKEKKDIWAEQQRITNLISKNEAIFEDQLSILYLFFPESDYVYSGAGLYIKNFFFKNICNYKDYPEEYWRSIVGSNMSIRVLPSTTVKVRYYDSVDVIPVITLNEIDGHIALVVTNQPANKLIEMMSGGSLTENAEFIILDSEGRKLLYIGLDVLADTEYQTLSTLASGSRYKEKRIFVYHSEDSGRTYLSMVSEHELNKITNTYIICFILFVVAFTVLGLFFAYIFAMRIYRPISQMANKIRNADKINNSINNCNIAEKQEPVETENHNDTLTTIQHGIDSLIMGEKSYKERCSEYAEYYVEQSIQLVINDILGIEFDQLKEDLQRYYNFKQESYLFACIRFDFSVLFFKQNTKKNLNELYDSIRCILQTLIETQLPCFTMKLQGGMYLCLINCSLENPVEEVLSLFQNIKVAFHEDTQYYSVSVGIGGHFTTLSCMKESYNQSIQAIRYCTSGDSFQVYDYNSVPVKSKITFSFYDQQKIVNSIKYGKKEMLNQVLNEIMDINNGKGISDRNMLELYRQLFSVGQRCLEDCCAVEEELESESRIRHALQHEHKPQDIEQIRNIFLEYFNEILDLANTNDVQSCNQQIEVIKEYVIKNYMENLYLDSIADVMGISPKYLSHLFKLKTGINLTEYINAIRMDKAKELLSSTNLKIGAISAMVGIDSRATFLRNFRKYEGCSPNEYRASIQKNG